MKKANLYTMLALASLLAFSGCEDFVEVDMPPTQLTAEAVFQSTATANAALANIYAGIREKGPMAGTQTGIANLMGGYADELDYYGMAGASPELFFTNTVLPSDVQVASLWSSSYSQIYASNAIIEGIGPLSPIPQPDKDRILGEALFLRAWLHFYLAGLYGDIPYVASTDYAANSRIARMPLADVYSHIAADLEQALPLLPDNDPAAAHAKPSRWAAKAMLAKVFLEAGRWAAAADAASAVLNNTAQFRLNPDLLQAFRNTSTETIWQLRPAAANTNTLEASTFIFMTGPPPNMALAPGLMATFEPGDARREAWTKAVSNGTQTWYHAYKYRQQGSSGSTTENSILLRIAEICLIRAEARARQGELSGAKEDLDAIRLRAGLARTAAQTQQEILNAVLQERRVELFAEAGHRFFDLRRFGAIDAVLGAKANWDATDALLPVPETELQRNPSLGAQNPGY